MTEVKTSPYPKLVLGLPSSELASVDLGGKTATASGLHCITELGKDLLTACAEGHPEEIRELLNRGAPFTADWLGTSPLHLAAQNNHLDVCEILLNAGISRDARTKVDRTPLHVAAYEGHVEVAALLLKNGAYCDAQDLLSMTPLHWAAQNSHLETVELLLRHGAQTHFRNKFDLTPMDIARQNNRDDIIEMIRTAIRDPISAVESLTVEFAEMDDANPSPLHPIETVLMEDVEEESSLSESNVRENSEFDEEELMGETKLEQQDANDEQQDEEMMMLKDDGFSESIKLLQQHGITMVPVDDSNILNSIIETGHSVVLTEMGKQVLNSTKPREETVSVKATPPSPLKPNKIITVTPQEFAAMTSNLSRGQSHALKPLNGKLVQAKSAPIGHVVAKETIAPVVQSPQISRISKVEGGSDIELLMNQLIEARKMVEEYKQKFLKKQAEAERYKQQLKLLMQSK